MVRPRAGCLSVSAGSTTAGRFRHHRTPPASARSTAMPASGTQMNRDSLTTGVDDEALPAIRGTSGSAMPTDQARCAALPRAAGVGTESDHRPGRWRTMNNSSSPWVTTCHDVVGRPRGVMVFVRGSTVVLVAPPGEVATLDLAEAERFLSVITLAAAGAATSAPGGTLPCEEVDGTASTVTRYGDGHPPAVAGRPASPSCRGGTGTPAGSAAASPTRTGTV